MKENRARFVVVPIVVFLSAIFTALAFPPVGCWMLILVAPAGWFWGLLITKKQHQGWLSFFWGYVFYSIQSFHTIPTIAQQARTDWAVGIFWSLLIIWHSISCAVVAWLVQHMPHHGIVRAVGFASAWVSWSWLRSLGEFGFPWGMLALSLARYSPMLQMAELGGLWIAEWAIVLWNALLAHSITDRTTGKRCFLAGVSLAGLWCAGNFHLYQSENGKARSVSVLIASVQSRHESHQEIFLPQTYKLGIERRIQQAQRQGAQWVVLPESTETQLSEEKLKWWQGKSKYYNLNIVLGATRKMKEEVNSALVILPQYGIIDYYDKVKLMPFTERTPSYVPESLIRIFGLERRSLRSGAHVKSVGLGKEMRIGTLICYEVLFGWVARHQVRDGAQWLTVMANDYWLIGRAVREQYADFCVVRAIETRRWVARASTVGISGFYAPTGELVASLPMGKPGVLVYPIVPRTDQTLYVRWGDWWAYGCLGVALVALVWGRLHPMNS